MESITPITYADQQETGMNFSLLYPQFQQTTLVLAPPENRNGASINLDKAIDYELKHGRKLDPNMDRKKLRRTVSNRISAQRSRQKKAVHVHDLERKANELEVSLIFLEEKMERMLEKRRIMKQQNEAMEQLLLLRHHQANTAQLALEKNRAELNRLKELQKYLLRRKAMEDGCSRFYEDGNEGDLLGMNI